jgi:NAD(P)-dependent dehydrogenase (short-subunit alcohol dehydrogenase family)
LLFRVGERQLREAVLRYGIHAMVWAGGWRDAEADRAIASAARIGYDILEIPVMNPDEFDAAHTKALLEKRNIDAISGPLAEDVTDEQWLKVVNVNLNGLFWCRREFGGHMPRAGRGVIVNIGSMSGLVVNKPQAQASYNASKAGVHQLTKSLAAEWAPRGVRVNAVAPTYIDTPMTAYAAQDKTMFAAWMDGTPMGRMGETSEVASVVLFPASDASSLLTGSIVVADAGYTCW